MGLQMPCGQRQREGRARLPRGPRGRRRRGFIRRGDQRYARLGKGGRNRLPQYCQIVWDLAVESDPSTLEWIKETHTAEHDPKTMGNTVDPAASTIMENGESKDVTPENAGTKLDI